MITKSPCKCDRGSIRFSSQPEQEMYAIFSDMEQNRNKRGGSKQGKSARRHKNRKRRK